LAALFLQHTYVCVESFFSIRESLFAALEIGALLSKLGSPSSKLLFSLCPSGLN
jgi:hypothetical protein